MTLQVRTTIEDREIIFLYFSLIWSWHSDKKVAGLKKKWVWQALYINCGELFFSNLRISPVGYKIKKENHNLHIFKT